jgi:uncharacterized protein (DUF4415 family)
MAIITSTVKVGQKPPREAIKAAHEAAKHPIAYTADCSPSTPEALKEFAMQAVKIRRSQKRTIVALRIMPDCLEMYKTLGKGYTGIMADVLNYVAENPEILSKVGQKL